jgi:hypothetical protein
MAVRDIVRVHPLRALSLRVSPVPAEAIPAQPASFALYVLNPGLEAIRVAMPKQWAAAQTQVEWHGIRNDVPLAQMTTDHSQTQPIGLAQSPPKWVPPTPEAWLELRAGGSVMLPFHSVFAWPAGSYDLQLAYLATLLDPAGKEIGRIEWVSAKSPFRMQRPK